MYTPTKDELLDMWFYERHYELRYDRWAIEIVLTHFWAEYVYDNNPLEWSWYIWHLNYINIETKEDLQTLIRICTPK